MDNPKISVLIPMYNRKHYIAQCVDSVLIQTFQDFEIIIRDNCSTDGSFEFVAEKYAKEISEGKIKIYRNEKNLGEWGSSHRLLMDAQGKYVIILHSDDMYLMNALEYLYDIAEETDADVVHSISFLCSRNGIIDENTKFTIEYPESQNMEKSAIMPNDPMWRFQEYIFSSNYYADSQYNLFNRNFIMENELLYESFGCGARYVKEFFLPWIMLAKVYVKTPQPFYIRRNSPDSLSNTTILPLEDLAERICQMMEFMRYIEKQVIPNIKFLNDNKESVRYYINAKVFNILGDHLIRNRSFYKDGVTVEVNRIVEDTFKKYFGDDAYYPAFLFHYVHSMPYYDSTIHLLKNTPS